MYFECIGIVSDCLFTLHPSRNCKAHLSRVDSHHTPYPPHPLQNGGVISKFAAIYHILSIILQSNNDLILGVAISLKAFQG